MKENIKKIVIEFIVFMALGRFFTGVFSLFPFSQWTQGGYTIFATFLFIKVIFPNPKSIWL